LGSGAALGDDSRARAGARVLRALLVAIGASIAAYAVSDHPFYGGEPGFGPVQTLIAVVGVGLALCALLPARIAGAVALAAATSLAMLAILEVAGERLLAPRHRSIYQTDDRLIFKFIPARASVMTRSAENGGETVAHRINSAGFRGPELRAAGEMTRLVVYGDSFIHAFYSRDEETFVVRLGAALGERLGRPVEAVNAGVSSYGPDQIALKMEGELPWLQPALVVVAIFAGNDYGDLLRNKIFRLSADGELVANPWKLEPRMRLWFELNQKESILVRSLRNTLGTRRGARDRYEGTTALDSLLAEAEREYRSLVVDRDDVVTNTHVDYYSADVSLTPSAESARYKVAFMGAVMRRIRDVAVRSGVPLVFLFIPHPLDVTDEYEWGPIDRRRFPDYDGRNQTAFLESHARSLGVPFLSLYDLFRARDARSLYLRGGDDHWNAAGQRLAAEVLAAHLLASGLLPTGRPVAPAPPRAPAAR